MDSVQKKKLLQVGNIIGFIATVVVNFLAIGLPINNKTTQELSDALPNLFVPAGITFSIWSIIYILLGIFATFAQIYMTKAYSFAKAGIIGTISYSNIAFSIILGLILGDSFPSILIIFGILLIVLSGLLVSSKKE